jgi:hypothetical protein
VYAQILIAVIVTKKPMATINLFLWCLFMDGMDVLVILQLRLNR